MPPSFDRPAATSTGAVTAAREPRHDRQGEQPLPGWWSNDDERPLAYVTVGSVTAGIGLFPAFYAGVLDQLAEVPVRVLLTLGQAGDPAGLGHVPPNVQVERWWPQRDVLAHAAVVIGHGGFGTTQAALEWGVPQVVLPLFSFDQFVNAERVADVGVGVALLDDMPVEPRAGDLVPRGPAATDGLSDAVGAVLGQPEFSDRARGLATEIVRLPVVDACVEGLAALSG